MSAIAIDLGGTKIAAARVDADGNILARTRCATPAREGREAILDAMAALVAELRDDSVQGIGIGAVGVIDTDRGVVLRANDTVVGWQGTDVIGEMRNRTGFSRIRVVNDVNAHARGEAWLGTARGKDSVLVIAVGTGIGGCWLKGGAPHAGAHYVAGHYGDVYVPHDLGGAHQLEAVASGPAIFRHYQALGGNPAIADTHGVFAAYAQDAIARRVIDTAANVIGIALASICHAIDPQVIVYGGGLADAPDWWWQAIGDSYRKHVLLPLRDAELVKAALGNDAALLGAASLILREESHAG
ncbi:MAG: ROK family protein [Cardiobacteriaceae bacterium]|nr:ROK family protein [Cardiobacteriaceae bacterium]